MKKFENQLERMRSMMNYGLQTESKNDFSGLEYKKEGPDGKTYGIIREGAKFYIKSADKKGKVLKEDFNYIGGFANRKNHEYSSFAVAQKQFDLVMASLQEVHNKKGMIVESWNPDSREYVKVEATQKMKDEISRQRQIMQRAALISENKVYDIHEEECKGKNCKVDAECANTQKKNIKQEKHQIGNAKNVNGDPYTQKPKMKDLKEEETLAWNDNYNYLDKSSGTEIGDSAPFDESPNSEKEMKNGVVEEGEAMHNTDNQNSPKPGIGEVGDDAPFDKPIHEDRDFFHNDDLDDEDQLPPIPNEIYMDEDEDFEEDFEDDIDTEGDEEAFDADFGGEDEDFDDLSDDDEEIEYEAEFEDDGVEERLTSLENTINAIADKLGVSDFDDDEPLYDDEEGDFDEEDEFGDDFDEEDEDTQVIESRNYKRVMAEARLNDFGKHPAYRKTPMQLPPNTNRKFDGYYDMNDDCVENDAPFGQQIGSGAPFEIDTQSITNAIAESLVRTLKNKKKH